MPAVVQARCPHCQNVLRIPPEWANQPMRCKFCKNTFQAKNRTPAPVAMPAAVRAAAQAAPTRNVAAPVVAAAVAVPAARTVGDPFTFDHAVVPTPPDGTRKRYRRGGGGWRVGALLLVCVVALAGIVAVALGPQLSALVNPSASEIAPQAKDPKEPGDQKTDSGANKDKTGNPPKTDNDPPKVEPDTKKPDPPKVEEKPKKPDPPKVEEKPKKPDPKNPPKADPYPRRALVVSVNDYLFANPLNYGQASKEPFPGSSTREVLKHLNRYLEFPMTQCGELSDHAPVNPHAPLKATIEATVTEFLNKSREQDRVVLVFAGHAVEIDKEAYLVPLEGDLKDAKTLIKLLWFYDQLKKCKSRQKVLVLDVCRLNQAAGALRPGSGEMTDAFDAQLLAPPPGVQVLSSCVGKQQAYEFESGSLFLQALCKAIVSLNKQPSGIDEPNRPLPVEVLTTRLNGYLDDALKPYKMQQTARLSGKENANGAGPNPAEPLPLAVAVVTPPPAGGEAVAGAAEIERLLDDINKIPPIRSSRSAASKDDRLKVSNLPHFTTRALEPYRGDPTSPELKIAVDNAVAALRESANLNIDETFFGNSTAAVKTQIKSKQGAPGRAVLVLEEALDELLKAGEDFRAKEKSKRWLAFHDYALVRLKSRLVYLMEYNYVLAQIRTDSLPPLEGGFSGYRLGSREKVTIPEGKVKEWAKEVRTAWNNIVKDYPDTPYAIMAQRERMSVLGLEWRPTRR